MDPAHLMNRIYYSPIPNTYLLINARHGGPEFIFPSAPQHHTGPILSAWTLLTCVFGTQSFCCLGLHAESCVKGTPTPRAAWIGQNLESSSLTCTNTLILMIRSKRDYARATGRRESYHTSSICFLALLR
jgi:hypothetical protein